MEIFNIYRAVVNTCFAFWQSAEISTTFIVGLAVGVVIWSALFILQGVGIYTMATKRGMEKRWLAFVPFANIMYIGRLSGPSEVFGQRMKNAALFAMIAQILTFVLYVSTTAAEAYLYLEYGHPQYDIELGLPCWADLNAFSLRVYKFYEFGSWILSLFQLVYEILLFILIMGLYKKYTPKNYTGLALLALFVPLSRYIVIFVLRNRTAIDYQAYLRARREAYMRQRQQYRDYGGYNGYGNNPYTPPQQPPQEEPFSEFSSSKSSSSKSGNAGGADENPFEEF